MKTKGKWIVIGTHLFAFISGGGLGKVIDPAVKVSQELRAWIDRPTATTKLTDYVPEYSERTLSGNKPKGAK